MARVLWRATVITHRYLGIAIGLLMVLWFISGIVMMYVSYPGLSDKERIQVLTPIAWDQCCTLEEDRFAGDDPIRSVELLMIAGLPSLKVRPEGQPPRIIDIPGGGGRTIDMQTARNVAVAAAPRVTGAGWPILTADEIERDQWTVGGIYGADRPLYRFAFGDPSRTELYVSSTTGEVVLWTTFGERLWNWFGAVPHWLYFTRLRQNGPLWAQIVIWTSLVGGFLTAIGLYLGIAQLGTSKSGRLSPYRGWFYWHHITGLAFGVLTLTWVLSGTVSMNPWGFLANEGMGGDRVRLSGAPLPWAQVRDSLAAIKIHPPADVSTLRSAAIAGRLYWLAYHPDGTFERLDANGGSAPVAAGDLQEAARLIAGAMPIAAQELRSSEDEYYFKLQNELVMPVYRITLNDEEATRFYLDPRTAGLIRRVDATSRTRRWLFSGLHRLDFAVLRARPLWDIVVVLLMLGGTALSATGVYLALWRIKRDFAFARRTGRKLAGMPAE